MRWYVPLGLFVIVVDVPGSHSLTRKCHEAHAFVVRRAIREVDELIDAVNTNALEDFHAG